MDDRPICIEFSYMRCKCDHILKFRARFRDNWRDYRRLIKKETHYVRLTGWSSF